MPLTNLFGKKFHAQGTSSKNITEHKEWENKWSEKQVSEQHKEAVLLKKRRLDNCQWGGNKELTLQKAQAKPPEQMVDQKGNYPAEMTSNKG